MSIGVKELLHFGEMQLKEAGIGDAVRDSKTIYCHLMNIPESRLLLEYQNRVPDNLSDRYFELIGRRAAGEPLQYIAGYQEFMGFKIKVDRRVLIPRLDTEVLVEDAVSLIEEGSLRGEVIGAPIKNAEILDLCCGSGAIGIAMAKLCTKAQVTCADISPEALELAKENAEANGVGKKMKFLQGNMFEAIKERGRGATFDMIICNPPYIKRAEIENLQKEVKDWEPRTALDGGEDGLDFYRIIAEEAPKHLKKRGILMLEIGFDQGEAVKDLLDKKSDLRIAKCLKDLAGLDRIIFAR